MEKKQGVFIYDRKEMAVLVVLGVVVSIFAFTLGVHLGKRVTSKSASGAGGSVAEVVGTEDDKSPDPIDIAEQAKGVNQAVEEGLNQTLHDEVSKSGLKLSQQRQVDLPEKVAPAAQPHSSPPRMAVEEHHEPPPAAVTHGDKKFYLQIGSFPTEIEAKTRKDELDAEGQKAVLQPVDLKDKGRWYRVFVGDYGSKDQAVKAAEILIQKKLIESYVITKRAD